MLDYFLTDYRNYLLLNTTLQSHKTHQQFQVIMPRDGSGRAHNEVEGGEIVHGAGDKDVRLVLVSFLHVVLYILIL